MSNFNSFGSSYTQFSTMGAETVPAAEKVRRHPKYYLNGGDVHFLVENYIFRVHRYFFERESAVFREKLNVPPGPGQNPKGSSDSNPIPLDEVREIDFSRFLWVFYNPKYSIYDANVDEWSSILHLSYDWRFPEVKRLASRYLEKFEIDPIQKIELYQTYEIDKRLLIPSYVALINRQEPLTIQEGRRLSLETALLIATARECARGKPLDSGKHSPTVASVDRESMVEIIKEVFGLANVSPASPALGPIWEGSGPSAFSATPMSPSKIITSPPREPSRDGAMSPTPRSKKKSQSQSSEILEPHISALLHGQSPTKPATPPVPPYLANVFNPPTSPETIRASKSSESKGPDPQNGSAVPPATGPAPAGDSASKIGQSVNPPPRQESRPRQQAPPPPLPPLEIPGSQETQPIRRVQQQQQPLTPSQQTQPPTPSRRMRVQAPDPPRQSGITARVGSMLGWLGSSKPKPEESDGNRTRKDSHEKRDSSSGYHMNIVTNTAHGVGTVGHEFYDSELKNVPSDSVSDIVARQKAATADVAASLEPRTTQSSLSESTHKQKSVSFSKAESLSESRSSFSRNDPAQTSAKPDLAPRVANVVSDSGSAINASGVTSAAGNTTQSLEAPSIEIQAATPPAIGGDEDPIQAHTDTSPNSVEPARATATQPVPDPTQGIEPTPAPAADKPADKPSSSAATKDVLPAASPDADENVTTAPTAVVEAVDQVTEPRRQSQEPQSKSGPVEADDSDGWNFQDGTDSSNAEASDSGSAGFKDAVMVNVPGADSEDDDVPLGVKLAQKQQVATEPAVDTSTSPTATGGANDQASASSTAQTAGATNVAQTATANKSSVTKTDEAAGKSVTDPIGANVQPKPAAGSNKNDSEPKVSENPAAEDGSSHTTAACPPDTSPTANEAIAEPNSSKTPAGESQMEQAQNSAVASDPTGAASEPKSEQPDDAVKPAEKSAAVGPDASEPAATAKAKSETETAAAVNEDATTSGASKPELHVDTSGAGDSKGSEAASAAGPTGQDAPEEGVEPESSVPKRLQEAGGDSGVTTESEMTSRPTSPLTTKKPKKPKRKGRQN